MDDGSAGEVRGLKKGFLGQGQTISREPSKPPPKVQPRLGLPYGEEDELMPWDLGAAQGDAMEEEEEEDEEEEDESDDGKPRIVTVTSLRPL